MVVVVVEMKEELVEVKALVKRKKRKMKWNGEGKIYIGFGFVKVMQINKREGGVCKMKG